MNNKIEKHYVDFIGIDNNNKQFKYRKWLNKKEIDKGPEFGYEFFNFWDALIRQNFINANIYDCHYNIGTKFIDEDDMPF